MLNLDVCLSTACPAFSICGYLIQQFWHVCITHSSHQHCCHLLPVSWSHASSQSTRPKCRTTGMHRGQTVVTVPETKPRHPEVDHLAGQSRRPSMTNTECSNSAINHITHNTQPFYGSVEFVRENPGEPVPEETFTHYSHRSHQSSLSAFSI